MRYKAMFVAGFAVGFVAGARSGRETYDKMVAYAQQVAEHPKVQQATSVAHHGARLRLFTDAADAVAGADAVYTDTWTSMGQEEEAAIRRQIFAPYQINDDLMSLARPGALFMHCLPAHRGEEVTADVFESDVSVVFDQAENRLHGQKALLLMLLAPAQSL